MYVGVGEFTDDDAVGMQSSEEFEILLSDQSHQPTDSFSMGGLREFVVQPHIFESSVVGKLTDILEYHDQDTSISLIRVLQAQRE